MNVRKFVAVTAAVLGLGFLSAGAASAAPVAPKPPLGVQLGQGIKDQQAQLGWGIKVTQWKLGRGIEAQQDKLGAGLCKAGVKSAC